MLKNKDVKADDQLKSRKGTQICTGCYWQFRCEWVKLTECKGTIFALQTVQHCRTLSDDQVEIAVPCETVYENCTIESPIPLA